MSTYANLSRPYILGIKKTPIVIAELLWKPFDVRFQGLLEKFTFHRDVVKDELIILGFQRVSEEQRQQIKERRAASMAREHTKVTMEMTENMRTKMEEKDKGTMPLFFYKI